MTLNQLMIGQIAHITHLPANNPSLRKKLMTFGVLPGQTLELIRTAPLGDPLHLKMGAFNFSIRRKDASDIHVEMR